MPDIFFPIFYGRTFNDEENKEELLINKYIYFIQKRTPFRGMGITNNEGQLCNRGQEPISFSPNKEYYFYVSDSPLGSIDFNRIENGFYSDSILINSNKIVLWPGLYKIGNQSVITDNVNPDSGKPMIVRIYGRGTQKERWLNIRMRKAIFFIGGIHRNELSCIDFINIMEDYIKRNTSSIHQNTTILVLNPVHSPNLIDINDNHRLINGEDPNRKFIDPIDFPEVNAIVTCINFLVRNFDEIIVISGHEYNHHSGRNDWRKTSEKGSKGVVLPLYIHGTGVKKAFRMLGDTFRNDDIYYREHDDSVNIANNFKQNIGFPLESVWHKIHPDAPQEDPQNKQPSGYIYPEEFMYYISNILKTGKNIKMIEFEISRNERSNLHQYETGLNNFIIYLLR